MRKFITIRGVVRREGVSKANKPYCFDEVHFTFPEEKSGELCAVAKVDPTSLPFKIYPGSECDAVFHFSMGRCYIDAIL